MPTGDTMLKKTMVVAMVLLIFVVILTTKVKTVCMPKGTVHTTVSIRTPFGGVLVSHLSHESGGNISTAIVADGMVKPLVVSYN
jgi:molybdopterin-binding protein